MKISTSMLNYYLRNITVSWFGNEDVPPDSIKEYLPLVESMKQMAIYHNDLEDLKLGFEYLLTHPDVDYEAFAGGRYPYESDEIRKIIEFAYLTIWSAHWPTQPNNSVQLISMSLEDWWVNRSLLNLVIA